MGHARGLLRATDSVLKHTTTADEPLPRTYLINDNWRVDVASWQLFVDTGTCDLPVWHFGAKHSSVASSLSGPSGEIGPSTLEWALGPLTQHSSRSRPYLLKPPDIVSRIITKNLLIPSILNFNAVWVSAVRSERPKMTH